MNCCICQFSVRVSKNIHTETVGRPPVLLSELVLQCTKGTNYELSDEASTICKKCCEKLTRYHKSVQIARKLRAEILELISTPFTTKALRRVASKSDIQVEHIDQFDEDAEEEEYLELETETVEDAGTITEEEEGEEHSFILKDAIIEEDEELQSVDLELNIGNEIIINDEEALEEGEMQLKDEAGGDELFKEETISDFDDHLDNTIEFLDSDVEDEQDQDSSGDYTVNIQCPSCPEKFGSRRGYNAHTKREHFPGYVCDQCGKTLQSYSGFIGHLQNHEPVKQFACPECPERFSRKFRLKHHMAWHTGETPYQCEVCSKRFVHKVALYKHKMIHDNETKRLECQVCGFKTRTKAHLERHTRSHTGDKPFACPMCNKRFSQMYNMKAHLREHETPGTNRHRRFHCSKCTHTFINEQNYTSHVERDDCTAV